MMDLRYTWPLDSHSIVFDVGAFEGAWAEEIARRYRPQLYLFEPQAGTHIDRLTARLASYPYTLFSFGLGERDALLPMGEYETDGCSFLKGEQEARRPGNTRTALGQGKIVDACDWLRRMNFTRIDLAAVNIEGYEYVLLPHLLDCGEIDRFERLLIQWHPFVDNALPRYQAIKARLEGRGYVQLWQDWPTWEAWKKQNG